MALTEQERDIARQIKEQGGTREDFIDILQQIRSKQPRKEKEPEPVKVEGGTPSFFMEDEAPITQAKPTLTLGKLKDIASKEQEIAQEKEEGFKGFITETGEALKERGKTAGEIIQRKLKEGGKALGKATQAFAEGDNKKAVGNLFKDQLNAVGGGTLQLGGQLVAAGGDIVWEGLENAIQDATPEVVEDTIEKAIAGIADTKTVQSLAEQYNDFKKNNPESARNIEAVLNISQIIPGVQAGKIIKKPFSEVSKQAVRKQAQQSLRDTGRAILSIPSKKTPKETLELTKFFADKVKPTEFLDDVVTQFDEVGEKAIKQVDNSLASVSKTFKRPQIKEVLKEMIENVDTLKWASTKKKTLNNLLKKAETEGLTLSEINKIKRSINDYTKGWSKSGIEGAGLKAESIRNKYGEVMKFIETQAKREGLPDIGALNKEWIKSNELSGLLGKQAGTIGKKKGLETLQKRGIIGNIGKTIFDLRKKFGLTDISGTKGLADLNMKDALEIIKKISKKTEEKTIQSKLLDIINKK